MGQPDTFGAEGTLGIMSAHVKVNSALVDVARWDETWRVVRLIRIPLAFRYMTRRLLEVFRQYVASEGKKALEVGCGGGAWMVLLGKHLGFQVYGLDYSLTGCRLAQQRLASESLPERIVYGDVFSAPFVLHSFDVVCALGVIEHFQDSTEIMRAMASLLRPGGQLVVGVPNMKGLIGYFHRLADRELWLRHVPLTPEDIAHLYKTLNLEVQYAEYVGTLCFAGPNWSRVLRSKRLGALVRVGLAGLETVLTWPLRILNVQLESPHFSPYVMVIGRKPFDASEQTLG